MIDPKTEKVEIFHHLIRDQNLSSLAWDPATRLTESEPGTWIAANTASVYRIRLPKPH